MDPFSKLFDKIQAYTFHWPKVARLLKKDAWLSNEKSQIKCSLRQHPPPNCDRKVDPSVIVKKWKFRSLWKFCKQYPPKSPKPPKALFLTRSSFLQMLARRRSLKNRGKYSAKGQNLEIAPGAGLSMAKYALCVKHKLITWRLPCTIVVAPSSSWHSHPNCDSHLFKVRNAQNIESHVWSHMWSNI